MLEYLQVFALEDGPASGVYVEWVLANPKGKLIWPFFNEAGIDSTGCPLWVSKNRSRASTRPLYVEATNGGPLGLYFMSMAQDPRRAKSLLISMFGHRNLAPCKSCENRYLKTWKRTPEGGTVHVMWPFFECVSIAGFHRGGCSNCAYHVETCSYATSEPVAQEYAAPSYDGDQDSLDGFEYESALLDKTLAMPPRKLTAANSARGQRIGPSLEDMAAEQRQDYGDRRRE